MNELFLFILILFVISIFYALIHVPFIIFIFIFSDSKSGVEISIVAIHIQFVGIVGLANLNAYRAEFVRINHRANNLKVLFFKDTENAPVV